MGQLQEHVTVVERIVGTGPCSARGAIPLFAPRVGSTWQTGGGLPLGATFRLFGSGS